jgi:hypothetical protein
MKRSRAKKNTLAPPAELPAAYGQTGLTLLDVDPFHIHAAWEITPRARAAAERKFAKPATAFIWVLRFHDERDDSSFDIPINPDAGSWYVELLAADKTYHAELGPYSVPGDFVAVCRSNTLTTPPAAPAPLQELQWLAVTGALDQAQRVAAPEREAEQKSEVRSQKSESRGALQEFPLAAAPRTEIVTPVAVAAKVENGQRTAAGGTQIEPGQATPLNGPQEDFPLAQPPHTEVVTPVENLGALEIPAAVVAALTGKAAAVSAAPAEVARSASSEAVGSFSMGGGAAQAAIQLELNAEVIVYGRAQPGQTLCVNGRPVPVGADGTFHVRWALPVAKP